MGATGRGARDGRDRSGARDGRDRRGARDKRDRPGSAPEPRKDKTLYDGNPKTPARGLLNTA